MLHKLDLLILSSLQCHILFKLFCNSKKLLNINILLLKKNMPRKEINIQFNKTDTGSPTKDETSETTVRNLNCLYPYITISLANH